MGIIKKLTEDISKEVNNKLDEIYNWRKEKEGLVSLHNNLINKLKGKINLWVEEELEREKRIDKFIEKK